MAKKIESKYSRIGRLVEALPFGSYFYVRKDGWYVVRWPAKYSGFNFVEGRNIIEALENGIYAMNQEGYSQGRTKGKVKAHVV